MLTKILPAQVFSKDWTLDMVIKTTRLNDCILSTPDKKVLNHVKNKYLNKFIFHERDLKTAIINSSLNHTIKDVLYNYEKKILNRMLY